MLNKEEIFLNLAELSEEEREEVIAMLPEPKQINQYYVYDEDFKLHLSSGEWWVLNSRDSIDKTEVNFQEFKEIMGSTETGAENTQVEIFDIDFGGKCMARMEIQNGKFKFTNGMNGGGFPIPIENIKITPTN